MNTQTIESIESIPIKKLGRPKIYTAEERKERKIEQQKLYYARNKDKIIEKVMKTYKEHRDEKIEYQKEYNEQHRDDYLQYHRRYYRDNIKRQFNEISQHQQQPTLST